MRSQKSARQPKPIATNWDGPLVSKWFSDETLFSLCSRQHQISNNESPKEICRQLFGDPRQGTSHDVPTRLGVFTKLTQSRFGDPKRVFQEHTLLPFYLGLQPPEFSSRVIQSAIDGNSSTIKAELGLLAGRLGAAHPLKACPKCIEHDLHSVHVGYWHVAHQLPGVWICKEHKEPLLHSNFKVTGLQRFGWCLPNSAKLVNGPAHSVSDFGKQQLFDIAVVCEHLRDLGSQGGYLSIQTLKAVYKNALTDQGAYFTQSQSSKQSLGNRFLELYAELRTIPDFAWINPTPSKAADQLLSLVVRDSPSSHPLKHALLINLLFKDWRAFLYAHDSLPMRQRQGTIGKHASQKSSSKETDPRREKLLVLLNEGYSKTAAAKLLGVTVSTAMVWSAQLGVRNNRRPKLLAETVRNQLIASLKRGIDKHIAAEQFQVSVQTITTTLRTEVGLHNSWQQARFVKAQKNARTLWQKAARTLSQPTVKSLRAKEPSVFAWLYRNDREWLTDFANSKLSLAVKTNHSPIDWQQRDVELLARVKQATTQWLDALQSERLTISKLCELVPGLKSKLSSRKRLPLTDEFLRCVTSQLVA